MTNYAEQLCQAAAIVAEGVVKDMKFDKTVKAVIVQNNDLDGAGKLRKILTGEYLCKYENMTFLAYGSPCAYDKDDVVYVNIPLGDWNNRKTISGNDSGVNIVYTEGTLKVFDNKGNYLLDITEGKTQPDAEGRKW